MTLQYACSSISHAIFAREVMSKQHDKDQKAAALQLKREFTWKNTTDWEQISAETTCKSTTLEVNKLNNAVWGQTKQSHQNESLNSG